MKNVHRTRRVVAGVIALMAAIVAMIGSQDMWQIEQKRDDAPAQVQNISGAAADELKKIDIKGRAAKTGYSRTQFGDGWASRNGCDTRNIILNRDLANVAVGQDCKVLSGTLADPYTGKSITFQRGASTSDDVQIDHVVALSDAWQKGAQLLTPAEREALANDPLELLAVDGDANQKKSDGDAASWLPDNKIFRCQYVARQIAVKSKYRLWVTQAEYDAMSRVLTQCPGQQLPVS